MAGFNFGLSAKKSNSKSTEKVVADKLETGSQIGSSTSNQVTTANQTSQQQGTSQSQGTSTTEQQGASAQTTAGSQVSETLSKLFSGDVQAGLEKTALSLLGGVGASTADAAMQRGLGQQGLFDPVAYVDSGVQAAQRQIGSQMDEATGGILDAIGGRNNSATALLQQRLVGDAAAQVAGVRNSLTGEASQIVNQNLGAASAAKGADSQLLSSILDILKGGTTSQTGQQQTNEAQSGTTAQTGTTTTTESNQSQQTASAQSSEVVNTVLKTLLDTLMKTHLNQQTDTKTSSSEMGGSAGFS